MISVKENLRIGRFVDCVAKSERGFGVREILLKKIGSNDMKIYQSVSQLIGETPLMRISRFCAAVGISDQLYAKLELANPAGSVKDRIAKAMIDDAEQRGLIDSDTVLIEPTSGNTGIGLASIAAERGYRLILTMPETMSIERRKLLSAYGAQIVLTEGSKGMQGAVDKAEELHRQTPNSFIPGQFVNPANPRAHFTRTGEEIWRDTDGQADVFVAGVGTGGTVSGVGKCLKGHRPSIEIVAVEPEKSPLISQGKFGPHGIQGIGANFIPATFDREICDRIVTVSDEDAFAAARTFARKEGILVGISSGAALHAAEKLAEDPAYTDKKIVVLLPDTGERYLSTALFGE